MDTHNNVKLIASQAHTITNYKNTKIKLMLCCANIYFNNQCIRRKFLILFYFVRRIRFHGDELLAPRPTPKLENHPLSAVRDAYSVYTQLPSISEDVPSSAT
jgi:hypothetical protein